MGRRRLKVEIKCRVSGEISCQTFISVKVLKSYNAPVQDLKLFYTSVIRSILEYCAQVWHGNLTKDQSRDLERIQKRAVRIIFPGLTYDEALLKCNLVTLESRREEMCLKLIESMHDPNHKLHSLLPNKVEDIRDRITRASGERLYNFKCRTERYKNSPIVYAIDRYNLKLS